VHDLVDFVSEEAEIAGRAAAKRILSANDTTARSLTVKTGEGVRYCVPQRIDVTDAAEDVRLFFRVGDPLKKVRVMVTDDAGNVLAKRARNAVAPGEMESITVRGDAIRQAADSGCGILHVYLEKMEV
jgi:hypothetical protein